MVWGFHCFEYRIYRNIYRSAAIYPRDFFSSVEIVVNDCGAGLKLRRTQSMPETLDFLLLRAEGGWLLLCFAWAPTDPADRLSQTGKMPWYM